MREGWASTKLGDICTLTRGAYPTERTRAGPYPLVVTAEASRTADSYQFNSPAVCIPTISSTGHGHASLKRVHYAEGRFAAANLLAVAQPKGATRVLARWLWMYLDELRDELIVPLMKGTANVNLTLGQLARVPVAMPPFAEQRRIVDLIDRTDDAIARTESEATALDVLTTSTRDEMLRAANETVPLGALIDRIEAGRSPEGEDRQPSPGEYCVLKVSAVRFGWFDPSQVKVVASAAGFPPYGAVRSGDLLITRANTRELVGAVCIVDAAPENTFLSDKTLRLVPEDGRAGAPYLQEALQSTAVRRQIGDSASGTSASMKNVSQEAIRAWLVPLVPPSEQRQIVAVLGSMRDASRAARRSAVKLRQMRKQVLATLLSGRHAIPESYDRFLDTAS